MSNELKITQQHIKNRIFTLRGEQVMLDRDLAEMYQVETKVLNQAVKRNIERFPNSFRFQLTKNEYENLRSQFVTSNNSHGGRRYMPYAFTEQGVAMLSAVLLCKNINSKLKLDLKKVNQQYGNFELKSFANSHDRFLIIDDKEIYHLGASLKDLGKKWFAFSKMNLKAVEEIMEEVERIMED
ncbi:MAG: ORF6N domain-containing protein [Bacteroidales bacterium]|nr:ORF6N domain-containing protein [Bacteroidales bacterium]